VYVMSVQPERWASDSTLAGNGYASRG